MKKIIMNLEPCPRVGLGLILSKKSQKMSFFGWCIGCAGSFRSSGNEQHVMWCLCLQDHHRWDTRQRLFKDCCSESGSETCGSSKGWRTHLNDVSVDWQVHKKGEHGFAFYLTMLLGEG